MLCLFSLLHGARSKGEAPSYNSISIAHIIISILTYSIISISTWYYYLVLVLLHLVLVLVLVLLLSISIINMSVSIT